MLRRNFLWYSLLFVAGCNAANSNSIKLPQKLRFAITDVKGLEDLEKNYVTFRKALEQVLETQIEFFPVENLTAAAPALLSGQVDLVLAGPSEYLILHTRAKATPVVGITRPGYRSVITVRSDSPIKSLEQLKGKTIALRSIGSTAGHLGANQLLIDAGLKPESDVKVVILHNQSMPALKNGEVDACALSIFGYQRFLAAENASEKDFPLIAIGPDLPNDVFVVNNSINPDLLVEMRSRMLANSEKIIQSLLTNDYFINRFKKSEIVIASDSDYDVIREVYQATGQGKFLQSGQ